MHALSFTGMSGSDGSLMSSVFRADGDTVSLPLLVFFGADLRLKSGEVNGSFCFRLFFAEVSGASGDVDMFKSTS
jgi:hypothetical protein